VRFDGKNLELPGDSTPARCCQRDVGVKFPDGGVLVGTVLLQHHRSQKREKDMMGITSSTWIFDLVLRI